MINTDGLNTYTWKGWQFRVKDGTLEARRVGTAAFKPLSEWPAGSWEADKELRYAFENLKQYPNWRG